MYDEVYGARQYASIFAQKTVKNPMSSFGYHISKVGFNRDNPKRVEICKGDTIVQEWKINQLLKIIGQ